MGIHRIALANVPFPATAEDSITIAVEAIQAAGQAGALIVCFPECFVPGYRAPNRSVAPPDAEFLERAWDAIAQAARQWRVAVVLGTERVEQARVLASALVLDRDGNRLGFQDKVQLDPSEDTLYVAGKARHVFEVEGLKFGIAICHEGWRYPETVRWAVQQGAQVVFHPHFHEAEGDSYRPTQFADPANTFHEKAALCRAAENTCFFATVNYASEGSPTTSAVVRPDGTLLCHQTYGKPGILVADLNLEEASRLLALRCKPAQA